MRLGIEQPGAGFRSDGGESANDSSMGGGGARLVPGPNVKGAARAVWVPFALESTAFVDRFLRSDGFDPMEILRL